MSACAFRETAASRQVGERPGLTNQTSSLLKRWRLLEILSSCCSDLLPLRADDKEVSRA
jgi:hypothetical protein